MITMSYSTTKKKTTKLPFTPIESIVEQRIVLIQLSNEGWNPKRVKTKNKKFQLRVSNAL